MLSDVSRVVRNQKYWVSLDISHSATLVLLDPEMESRGQAAQGSVARREERK